MQRGLDTMVCGARPELQWGPIYRGGSHSEDAKWLPHRMTRGSSRHLGHMHGDLHPAVWNRNQSQPGHTSPQLQGTGEACDRGDPVEGLSQNPDEEGEKD